MSRKINRVGETRINNFGSWTVIIDYRGVRDIDVYFPQYEWTAKNRQYKEFTSGKVSCPYERRTHCVGFIGEGDYKVSENGKNTKCYDTWNQMLNRCYNPKCQKKHPTYIDCEVAEEWCNFQVFAEWYHQNYYEIEGQRMCLDKDILVKGNKVYSEQTCVFVPQSINNLFVKCDKVRGGLPIGVCYNKQANKYQADCKINGKLTYLGLYDTPEQAFQVYKQAKEEEIKRVAEEYEELIPRELYVAMMNYKVEIND